MNFNKLTKGERFVVEWYYEMAGSFHMTLAKCFALADTKNRSKLMLAFPEEGEAMYNFHNTPNWWVEVKEKAGV